MRCPALPLLLACLPLVAACDAAVGPRGGDDGRLVLETDRAALSDGVTVRRQSIALEPALALPEGLAAPRSLRYSLTLVAEVAPPVVDGLELQATSVAFSDSVAVVGYNVAGDERRGAVEVFVFDAAGNPTRTSRATFADADVNAVGATSDRVLLATASADPAFTSPAVLEALALTPDGTLGLAGHFRTGLASFGVTSVVGAGDRIYATSGDHGGVTALSTAGAILATTTLDDARGLAVPGDGTLVAVRGTPGEVVVYDAQTLAQRRSIPFTGATIPESKGTVEVLGGKAFVAGGPAGALVFDLADGRELAAVPVVVRGAPDPDRVTNAVTVEDDLVFVSNGAAGVFLVAADRDLAEPEVAGAAAPTFQVMGRLAFPDDAGSVNHVTYRDGYLFVASGRAGLKIVRVEATCTPRPEVDDNGIDDDCDGVTDVAQPTCADGARNGDESDVDCGGSCGPCADGGHCAEDADCAGGHCAGDVCEVPCPPAAGLATVCLLDSTGAPLVGARIDVARNGAAFSTLGWTDAKGRVTTPHLGNLQLRAYWGDATLTRPVETFLGGEAVEIRTVPTIIRFVDHAGAPLDRAGANLTYHGNTGHWQFADAKSTPWHFGASGELRFELLPVPGYVFQLGWAGATQTATLDVAATGSELVLRTVEVVASVRDSHGAPFVGAPLKYRGPDGSWQLDPSGDGSTPFATDDAGELRLELLPLPGYLFETALRGATATLPLDADSATTVAFRTTNVTVGVHDSSGAPLANVKVAYYGNQGKWQYDTSGGAPVAFTTDALGLVRFELLPVRGYAFEATLRGASQTKALDASLAEAVAFETVKTTFTVTKDGAPLDGVGVKVIGPAGDAGATPPTVGGVTVLELLPGYGYEARVTVGDASGQAAFAVEPGCEVVLAL